MEIIDNISTLLGDDLKSTITPGAKFKIAASCFSIYAFEALKKELLEIDSLEFIFTSPTFVHGQATDKLPKEKREFFIPKLERERSLYGTEFEIQLRNKLTQRAIARLLDLARTACKGRDEPFPDFCAAFNESTENGRDMNRYSNLLGDAIRSMIEVKEAGDLDSLFTPGKTTALVDSIQGLDDFELISFLVIQATPSHPTSNI